MTPAVITITHLGQIVLDGPSIDSLTEALKDGSTVEFTLLPTDSDTLRRKFKLRAKVRRVGNVGVSEHDLGRSWYVVVEFISSRRFKVTNTSPVEIHFFSSGYGDRPGGRGATIWDATPDEERIWVARGDGSIVRGLDFRTRETIGNVKDLPGMQD